MAVWCNGDDVAFPINDPQNTYYPGLTKREHFATEALKGLLSSGAYNDNPGHEPVQAAVHTALRAANLLINKLNEGSKE